MINVKTFVFNDFQMNTYVLSDESDECIIIDPGCQDSNEFQLLFNFLKEKNLKPLKIVNTHGHIDHILGCARVSSELDIPFLLHKADELFVLGAKEQAMMFGLYIETVPEINAYLDTEEPIKFGNSIVNMLHVPGHSPGSIVFYSEQNKFLITGDVLFNGSIGRTDLPMGNYEQLITGIKNKLLVLPHETLVYPGHGPTTTIGVEYDTNPFLI